jgi:hypothetical protein
MSDMQEMEREEVIVELSDAAQAQESNPNVNDQLGAIAPEIDDEQIEEKLSAEDKVKQYLESDEELQDYGDGVQNRINKLTYNWRESERREQAAVDYAQKVQAEMQGLRDKQTQQDGAFINEYKGRVESQLDGAKRQYKEAYELGDADLIADANTAIARHSTELVNAEQTENRFKRNATQPQQPAQQQFQQQPQQPVQRAPDVKAEGWAEKNEWFGQDAVMTNAAMTVHQELVQNGYAPESDQYYQQIDKRMRSNFPHKFEKPRQQGQQQVTPGGNAVRKNGKRSVKLSASQVNIAKRLGVSLEDYAKYV